MRERAAGADLAPVALPPCPATSGSKLGYLTESGLPGLAPPLPQREHRRVRVLTGLLSWVKARSLFGSRPAAHGTSPERSEQRTLDIRPPMAAVWYSSLGPGPMCLPGQPAIGFNPGYRD
jgi:hypothetical protein